MRYCAIAYTFYPIDYRVRRYVELFSDSSNTVHAIALRSAEDSAVSTLNGVTIFHVQKREYDEKNSLDFLWKILHFFFVGMWILTRNFFRYRYQLIHIHNVPDFLVFMAWIPKLFGAKIVLDIHDVLPELYCEKFHIPLNSMRARFLKIIEKLSVRFADNLIVANDLWLNKIRKRSGISHKRSYALLNYPNLTFYNGHGTKSAPNNGSKDFIMIYPGHLSYHHGIDIAIHGMDILCKAIDNIKFHIYARTYVSGYRKELEDLIDKYNLADRVLFFNALPPEEIPHVLAGADIGIAPKRGGGFAEEAFSSKLFDFFAAGLPIVASRTKIDTFYFSDKHIQFFEDGNPLDFANKVIELYHNPQRQQELRNEGLLYVKENNWIKKSIVYKDMVSQLLISS